MDYSISKQDALNLLSKFESEKSPIKSVLIAPDRRFSAVTVGEVFQNDRGDIVIAAVGSDPSETGCTIVPLDAVKAFGYQETKDADELPEELRKTLADKHGIAQLRMALDNGWFLTLFER